MLAKLLRCFSNLAELLHVLEAELRVAGERQVEVTPQLPGKSLGVMVNAHIGGREVRNVRIADGLTLRTLSPRQQPLHFERGGARART